MAVLKDLELGGFTIEQQDDTLVIDYGAWTLIIDVMDPDWPVVTIRNPPYKFGIYEEWKEKSKIIATKQVRLQ